MTPNIAINCDVEFCGVKYHTSVYGIKYHSTGTDDDFFNGQCQIENSVVNLLSSDSDVIGRYLISH